MRKTILASLLFAVCTCICARAEVTPWFAENAESFQLNAAHRWHYIPGVADAREGLINAHYVEELRRDQLEARYLPAGSAATAAVVSNEFEMCFNALGDETKDSCGSIVGVQVVEGFYDYHVFAVLLPAEGSAAWRVTDFPAETNVIYRFTAVITYTPDGGFVKYLVSEDGVTQREIADVPLPKLVAKPTVYALYGDCRARGISAWVDGETTDAYCRWRPLRGVFTWRGGASVVAGEYDVFDLAHGVDLGLAVATGGVFDANVAAAAGGYMPPGCAIRFTSGVEVVAGSSHLRFGGMIVEQGADGVKISGESLDLGDPGGTATTSFRFLSDTTLGASGNKLLVLGDCTVEVAEGKVLDMSAATSLTLSPAAVLRFAGGGTVKLPAGGMIAADRVTIDYSSAGPTFQLVGQMTIGDSTSFGLPAGVSEGGDGFRLVSGTVTGGASPVRRAVTVGEDAFVADVTVSADGRIVYHRSAHGDWSGYPAVFTWAGSDDGTFAAGRFRLFDCGQNRDTDVVFRGGETATDVPGWADGVFRDVLSVFNDRVGEGLPLCRDAGYVLRLAAGPESTAIDLGGGSPVFGGLLVEPGAFGYEICGAVEDSHALRFAAPSAAATNRVEINEDLAVRRTAPIEFYGRSHLQVAAGKRLSADHALRVDATTSPREDRPYLSLAGDGEVTCLKLETVGAATLDFSAMSRGASEAALVRSPIEISPETRLVLPAGLAAGAEYPLSASTVTMDSGVRAVAFGDGEFSMKSLSVNGGKVSWGETAVNAATLTADCSWSSISGGFAAGRPVVLTLTRDVRLSIDPKGVACPALLVLGDHRLQIVMTQNANLGNVYLGRKASCEYVYNMNCYSFSSVYTVPAGKAYDVAIEGATGNLTTWNQAVTVLGRLILRNRINLSHGDCTVSENGSVLVDSGATASLAGSANSLAGRIEVAAGATFTPTVSQAFAHDGREMRLTVKGTLDLGETAQTLGLGSMLEMHGGAVVSCSDGNGAAITLGSGSCVHVCKGADDAAAELRASVVCAGDCRLLAEVGSKLLVVGASELQGGVLDPSGAGTVELTAGASLAFTNDCFCTGGLVGEGVAYFYGDPSRSPVCPSLTDGSWTGEVRLRGASLEEFDPGRCGNPASTISFDGSYGYFAKDVASSSPFKMIRQEDVSVPSLDVRSGYDDSGASAPKVFGDGLLRLANDGFGNYRHRIFIEDAGDYDGSYEVAPGSEAGIVLGTADYAGRHEEFDAANDGRIAVTTGMVEIAAGARWKASGGIRVDAAAAVTDSGDIQSPVIGEGSVRYYGDLLSSRPELNAKFDDEQWHGTVEIHGGRFTQRDLMNSGNVNSRILLEGVEGSLAPQVSETCLVMSGTGLGVDSAVDNGMVQFRKLAGSGSLRVETGDKGPGSSIKFCDVEDFTGRFLLDSETTSVLFGEETIREADATLSFGRGVRVHCNQNWRAPYVTFADRLTLIGASEGDAVVKAFNAVYVYLDHVLVDIEQGLDIDSRIRHGLAFDPDDTKEVFLTRAETPPTMDIGVVDIRYGTDFTNATVTLSVTNFWGGYEFNGLTYAEVRVYDANGHLVGAGDCLVDGDGEFVIGGASLPFGRGSDHHYEVGIRTEQRTTGEIDERGETSVNAAGVRYVGGWFDEDAESFSAEAPSALKTGDWTYDAGAASTNGEHDVVFNTVEVSATAFASFEPYLGASNDYVRVHYGDVTFDTMFDFGSGDGSDVDIGGGFAALTLACDYSVTPPQPYFAVWACDGTDSTSGRFERVSSVLSPAMGERYSVDCTINRGMRTIGYMVNGTALTNREGRAFFPLPDAALHDDYKFLFKGTGKLADLSGSQDNANLAAVVNGSTTNEYATVDEAVAAATNAGDRVTLLWDASWRPRTEDVGRTVSFTDGGYTLYVDPVATNRFAGGGYRFVENGDGSYTIGVVEYEISFLPNDALGSMAPQKFSVTNMVFNLVSNAFERTGSDFDRWNENENGRGLHSWSDGGVIDMREFGLADKKLYAQWRVAAKTILIEPADEFVYVERVTTNGLPVADTRYLAHADAAEREKGRGSAEIRVLYGSTLVVRFSTDIGKLLTTPDWKLDPGYRQYSYVTNSFRVANIGVNLPHYSNDVAGVEAPAPLDEVGAWAIIHGIPLAAAAESPFALASSRLNVSSLLTEDTEILISDFRSFSNSCMFKVTIDGNPLDDASRILPMIRVTGDLAGEWREPDSAAVSVDGEGMVTVITAEDSSFVKILIPKSR